MAAVSGSPLIAKEISKLCSGSQLTITAPIRTTSHASGLRLRSRSSSKAYFLLSDIAFHKRGGDIGSSRIRTPVAP